MCLVCIAATEVFAGEPSFLRLDLDSLRRVFRIERAANITALPVFRHILARVIPLRLSGHDVLAGCSVRALYFSCCYACRSPRAGCGTHSCNYNCENGGRVGCKCDHQSINQSIIQVNEG